MRAATSVALIALLATPAFAAPISAAPKPVVEEGPSLSSQVISSAAGGAASGLVGNLLSKLEGLFSRDFDERSVGSLTNIVKQAQTLSPTDKAAVKNALMNKIGTLQGKRDASELDARAPLSATSFGGSLLSSAAGGAASGAVGNLLGLIEGLFRRDDFELEARAPLSATGLGGSIVSSAAGGAASGLVGNLLGLIEGLFRRDFTDAHDEEMYVKRDVGSISTIIKQSQNLSAADKATVKTALMNKIGTLQGKRDDSELEARAPLSATSFGGSLLSSAAGGAASGAVGNLLGLIEGLFRRDEFELEARAPLSANGLGGSIISSAAGGAASGLVGNLLGLIEGLFRRDFSDVHDEEMYVKRDVGSITTIIKQSQNLSAADKATVKTALMNKIGTLTPAHAKRLSASGAAGTALGGLASVGANGLVSGILEKIESLFRRDEFELEARAPLSAGSLGGSIVSSAAGGAASGLVGNLLGLIEGLFRRDFTDVHDEEMYVKRDVGSISTIIKQSQNLSAADKATVKTALMNKIGTLQTPSKRLSASGAAGTALGGLASVGANGLVSGILEKIESLFRREEELHEMQRRAPLSASSFKPSGTGVTSQVLGGLAGGAASGLVGNLLSEFESLFRRAEELSINDLD